MWDKKEVNFIVWFVMDVAIPVKCNLIFLSKIKHCIRGKKSYF